MTAQPIRDFKVYSQPFPDIPVNERAFDAVTAWAVLDHVHDPMAYFRKASLVTKEGGLFVFLVTNFESISSRYLFGEDLPRHLYFFTEETVRGYLETTGFKLERADCRDNVHAMAPRNWLGFLIRTGIRKQSYSYHDVPLTRPEFYDRHNLRPGALSLARFIAAKSIAGSGLGPPAHNKENPDLA